MKCHVLLGACFVVGAYVGGPEARWTVKKFACPTPSVVTQYHYDEPAPAGALTEKQVREQFPEVLEGPGGARRDGI